MSQALSAEVRSQPRVTPDSATRAVYENLFGCPAQFASVAEVHPDSQGPAGDANVTPFKGSDNGVTPATMLALSAFTEHSDHVKSNEKVAMVGTLITCVCCLRKLACTEAGIQLVMLFDVGIAL